MKYLDWGIYNFIVQEIILSKEKRNYSCCHLIFTKVSRIKFFLGVAFKATICFSIFVILNTSKHTAHQNASRNSYQMEAAE